MKGSPRKGCKLSTPGLRTGRLVGLNEGQPPEGLQGQPAHCRRDGGVEHASMKGSPRKGCKLRLLEPAPGAPQASMKGSPRKGCKGSGRRASAREDDLASMKGSPRKGCKCRWSDQRWPRWHRASMKGSPRKGCKAAPLNAPTSCPISGLNEGQPPEGLQDTGHPLSGTEPVPPQ